MLKTGNEFYLIVLMWVMSSFGYEASLPNLVSPSALTPVTLEIDFQHRFGRALTQKRGSNFFGGANTATIIRGAVWRGLDINCEYATNGHAFSAGAGYSHEIEKILTRLRGDIQYFSYELVPREKRVGNILYLVSAQSVSLLDRFIIGGSIGYDGYNQHVGAGISVVVAIVEQIDLFGEYSPLIDKSEGAASGKYPSYCGGLKINTDGHHFKLLISNATGIGIRSFLLGTRSNEPHFGFSIQRLFRFRKREG